MQFWSVHHANGIAKLESIQSRATKMIPALKNKPYEERLSHLTVFSLEKRLLRGYLIEYFKLPNGFTNRDATNLLMMDDVSESVQTAANFFFH